MKRRDQILLLDADDTLWENNIYFERAKARFITLIAPAAAALAAAGLGWEAHVRACINREERRVIAECGYGVECFRLAISRAFQALAPERWDSTAEAAVAALADSIAREPIELLPGAGETLEYLASRHRLVLMTKGDYAEQTRKLKLSGLAPRFEQVHVVAEKNVAAYRQKVQALQASPGRCWMIGNSPKSDINPALAAGLNAVFIPHPHTWVLERCDIAACAGRECLRLERLRELCEYF